MFSELIVGYLFLGGAGGGALVVLSILELMNLWRLGPYCAGADEKSLFTSCRCGLEKFFVRMWPVCLVLLSAAVLCLMADLGRPDRLLILLMSPSFSLMNIGVYALGGSIVCAVFFMVCEFFEGVPVWSVVVGTVGIVGVFFGFATMLYTGLLLQSLPSILFWQTCLLPALFTVSSLSCGLACVIGGSAFVEGRGSLAEIRSMLIRADSVCIVVELACLAAYLVWGLSTEGTLLATQALLGGNLCALFLVGVVGCGLVVPLVFERYKVLNNERVRLALAAALVLAGGFALRYCIVEVAVYDVTQMANTALSLMG